MAKHVAIITLYVVGFVFLHFAFLIAATEATLGRGGLVLLDPAVLLAVAPLATLVALEVDGRARLTSTGSLAIACSLAGPNGGQELWKIFMVIILSPEFSLEFLVLHLEEDLDDDLIFSSGEATLCLAEAVFLAR